MIHQWKNLHKYYSMEAQNLIFFFFKEVRNLIFVLIQSVHTLRNHSGFVNISTTVVNDTSMERSSPVLQHGHPKIRIFSQKSAKLNFDMCQRAERHNPIHKHLEMRTTHTAQAQPTHCWKVCHRQVP